MRNRRAGIVHFVAALLLASLVGLVVLSARAENLSDTPAATNSQTPTTFPDAKPGASLATEVVAGLALLGAIFAGVVSLRTNARSIKHESVTKERIAWRERVRSIAYEVDELAQSKAIASPEFAVVLIKMRLNVNPVDRLDSEIVDLIGTIASTQTPQRDQLRTEFADRVALLLKHDWERGKWEAASTWGKAWLFLSGRRPVRIPYVPPA